VIRGRQKKYSDHLPEEFVSFLCMIDSANVTYTRKSNRSNDVDFSEDSFKFNGHKHFERSLIDAFEPTKKAVRNFITQYDSKSEALFAINDLITEVSNVKSFLTYINGVYAHFHTYYKSEGDYQDLTYLGEKTNIQGCLQLIKEYSEKLFFFLDSLRSSYVQMPQKDIVRIHNERKFKVLSDEHYPLRFLDYLLTDEWRQYLLSVFFENIEGEGRLNFNYCYVTEIGSYTYCEPNTGDDIVHTVHFSSYLEEFAKHQIDNANNTIETYLGNSDDKFQTEDRLVNLLSKIEYFIIDFRIKEKKKSYETTIDIIVDFALFLIKKYSNYLAQEENPSLRFSALKDIVTDELSKNEVAQNETSLLRIPPRCYFEWNSKNPLVLTTILYKGLVDHGFIDSDDYIVFSQLFSGNIESIQNPVQWNNNVNSKRGLSGISNLFYLFKQLSDNGLIMSKFEDEALREKIKYCFIPHNGKPIKSFSSAKQEDKRKLSEGSRTKQQIQINGIMEMLLKSNRQ